MGAVADDGSFASTTPIMKLRYNAGLFDGKLVSLDGGPPARLHSATESAFVLDEPGVATPVAGQPYVVYDVGPGDAVEIVR